MPYYREKYLNDHVSQRRGGQAPTTAVLSSTELLTYRSNRRQGPLISEEIPDHLADPYAYFLGSVPEKRYQTQLAARGLPSKGSPDRGHPFQLIRHTIEGWKSDALYQGNPNSGNSYRDAFVTPELSSDALQHVFRGISPTLISHSTNELPGFAQMAYNRTAPSAVMFDAAQFLGELREGLPRLSTTFLRGGNVVRDGASNYLGLEFGVKPLIQEVQALGRALGAATTQLMNVGQRVHRKFSLPQVEVYDLMTASANRMRLSMGSTGVFTPNELLRLGYPFVSSNGPTDSHWESVRYTLWKKKTVRRWFEGEFTNFLPLTFDPDDYLSRLSQLVKLKPDFTTVWQLSPFSWLVDWFLRIEDTIAANEKAANDLLVMHYGYAMEHAVYKIGVNMRKPSRSTYEVPPIRGISTSEYKTRIRANPFGFQINTPTQPLTDWQSSILAALALTKGFR